MKNRCYFFEANLLNNSRESFSFGRHEYKVRRTRLDLRPEIQAIKQICGDVAADLPIKIK